MANPIIFSTKSSAEKRRKSLDAKDAYTSIKIPSNIMELEFGINKEGWVITSTMRGSPKKYVSKTSSGKITGIVKGNKL